MADETVPFYKSQRYVDKKLAPEQMPMGSLIALANATKIALRQGLIRPDVADKVLANAMVEGRAGDYGVNKVDLPAKSTIPKQLDIDSFFSFDVQNVDGYPKPNKNRIVATPDLDGGQPGNTARDKLSQDYNARLAITALISKQDTAKRLGRNSVDDVFQLWNGVGPDSERHLSRVNEADKLLKTDPMNAQLKFLWDSTVNSTTE